MENQQSISDKTKADLLQITFLNIESSTNVIDMLSHSVQMLLDAEQFYKKNNLSPSMDNHHLKRLTEYTMLINLISLDISSTYRIYLNALTNYEVQFATKLLVLITNEGFKQIYNYVYPNDKGDMITSKRNKSFWVRDIGKIVKNELPLFHEQYSKLTIELNEYDDQELKAMKPARDLFVHYDIEPSKVYDELQKIHIETVSQKVIPFLSIIMNMSAFCLDLTKAYEKLISQKTTMILEAHHLILDNLKKENINNLEAITLLDRAKEDLKNILGQ